MTKMPFTFLVLNAGSSSLKYAIYQYNETAPPERLFSGNLEKLTSSSDHKAQLFDMLLDQLQSKIALADILIVGHRFVHGGPDFFESVWVDGDVIRKLEASIPLALNHLPAQIELLKSFQSSFPQIRQYATFDTAFHANLPEVARLLPIPRALQSREVRRYGFHGISYSYLMTELDRVAGREVAEERTILAHLGNGASMAAVHHGVCIDTSMSFTPTSGLVMGTRTGDIDPGLILYLQREQHLSVDQLETILTQQSGMLGISESSSDMRELQQRRVTDSRADEAISLFCYQAKKQIGAYIAALGGLKTLVFSGGIGEHAAAVRLEICRGLNALGIIIDEQRNAEHASVISAANSPVVVRVILTNEELMIARELEHLLNR
ncbi:acetate/propionate family kinase [Planctomicrobium sp. SH527]|uniref:acetate/propionate family kinase n=1 Tax=Planctomicrobium sp. SH527 TaxID=3448123 RepID=UPI003F5BCA2F